MPNRYQEPAIVSAMANATPAVELVPLLRTRNVAGKSGVVINAQGAPEAPGDDRVVSRWLGTGNLAVAVRDSSSSAPRPNVLVEHGRFRLILTRRRVIAAFHSSVTVEWGSVETDGSGSVPAAAVVMVWPLVDVSVVRVSARRGVFSGKDPESCSLRGHSPAAVFTLRTALNVGPSWRRCLPPRPELRQFVNLLIPTTIAAYRAAGEGDPGELAEVEHGRRRRVGRNTDAVFRPGGRRADTRP